MERDKKKFAGMAKVGEKGQIVIPREIRQMFEIKPGDTLLLLADGSQGIVITKSDALFRLFEGKLGYSEDAE